MSRATRLMRLTELLRASDTATTTSLAEALEVSERTLRRDLAALRDDGLAITGDVGRGGGLRLEGDHGAAPVRFTLEEAVSLWLTARLAQRTSLLPWSDAASDGMTRLVGSLPKRRARELRELLRRVVIGPAPTPRMVESLGRIPREAVALVEAAFTARVAIGFEYRGATGRASFRRVEPHGLLVQSPLWYVLGFDLDAAAARIFRMDRISRVRRLVHHFEPRPTVIDALLEPGFAWERLR